MCEAKQYICDHAGMKKCGGYLVCGWYGVRKRAEVSEEPDPCAQLVNGVWEEVYPAVRLVPVDSEEGKWAVARAARRNRDDS